MQLPQYPRYESYKPSGVEWLGDVPGDWQVTPGRACLYENKDKNTGMKESTVLSLSYGNVIVKPEEKLTGLVPESFETYQIVEPGDIIIRGTDLQNDVTSLRTGLAKNRGIITSAYINLRPHDNVLPFYLHYVLHSYDVKKVFYGLGSGLRQNLSYEDFKYLDLPLPDIATQERIVAFLDDKTDKIDRAVKIKEGQIALLRERKQIVVEKMITKGMRQEATLKESGNAFLGDVPAGWRISKIRFVANLIDGDRGANYPSGDDLIDEGVPFLSSKNIIDRKLDLTALQFISEAKFRSLGRGKLMRGDLIITMRGTTGNTAIFECPYETGFINAQMLIMRPRTSLIDVRFLHLLSSSDTWEKQINFLSYGSAQQQLSGQILKDISLALPPLQEQEAILEFVDAEFSKIDRAIDLKIQQIELLKEYKATLINAAVTGKIRVI